MIARLPIAQLLDLGALDCARGLLVFLAIVAPIYLVMRSLVRLTRIRYGFVEDPVDDGPELRICQRCGNTVMELDFQHCPYCGLALPVPTVPRPAEPPLDGPKPDAPGAP